MAAEHSAPGVQAASHAEPSADWFGRAVQAMVNFTPETLQEGQCSNPQPTSFAKVWVFTFLLRTKAALDIASMLAAWHQQSQAAEPEKTSAARPSCLTRAAMASSSRDGSALTPASAVARATV